jgi:hypothetical protein
MFTLAPCLCAGARNILKGRTMPGQLTFSLLDYSREKSSFSITTGDVTAVSLPGLLSEVGALRTAIEGITLGTVSDEALRAFNTNLSNTPPTNPLAQVESAWLVTYEDATPFFDDPINAIPNEGYGRLFTLTIPTADIAAAGRLAPNSDEAVLTEPGMAAFVSALETTARSPYGGNIRVVSIRHVGRNR